MRQEAGFTLVEMLLSVAILTALVGMSLPLYTTFVQRNDLDITAESVAVALRRAETYARAVQYDSTWSIELQSSSVTLFQGTNFAGRNTSYDETLSLPGSITLSGLSEIQFAKFSATPNTTGNIVLTSNTNDTRTISVNAKGMVDY